VELDLIVQRHTTDYRIGAIDGETFYNFLEDALKKQKKRTIPWNIPYFWWAIGLSLASLLLGSTMYFSKNARVKDHFDIAKSEAARLNNLAVDYYTEALSLPEEQATDTAKFNINFKGINPISSTTSQFLGQAIFLDSVFEKAHINHQKLMYNDGLAHYESYLKNKDYPLVKAKYPLKQAINYPSFRDTTIYHSALLTLANIHQLLNEQDSVCQLLATLVKINDTQLLAKVLRLKKQAVYCADQPVPILIKGQVVDAKTLKGVQNVLVKQKNQQVQSDQNGYYQLQVIKAPNQAKTTLAFSHKNYQSTTKPIELIKDNLTLPVVQLISLADATYLINGRIINRQTGNPLSNILIANTTSNEYGYFRYTYTPVIGKEREIAINIQANGYLPYQKVIAVDQLPSQLKIELTPQVSVVTLSDFDFPIPSMVLVPSGTFMMGCTPEQAYVCQLDERPAHKVQLDSFEIGKYEVTNEEFVAFLNEYGRTIKSGPDVGKATVKADPWGVQLAADGIWQAVNGYNRHPAIGMTQYSAVEYCKWLSQKTSQTWRLPTEAEWEYAARGGPKNIGYIFAGGNNLESVAWCYKNSFEKGGQHPNYGTNSVGQRKSNELGIHDMSGNVFEWISGWYQEDAYEKNASKLSINPQPATSGTRRMMRGGSWYLYSKDDARVANRVSIPANTRGNACGFRVVRVWK